MPELYDAAGRDRGEHKALLALGIVGLAVLVVIGAYLLGRSGDTASTSAAGAGTGDSADVPGSSSPGDDASVDPRAARQVADRSLAAAALGVPSLEPQSRGGSRPTAAPSSPAHRRGAGTNPTGLLRGQPYHGPLAEAAIAGASASCTALPAVDAGGNRVGYSVRNAIDGVLSTAWRCDGDGRGVTLTLRLARPVRIGAVALVPGYAKTDPYDGANRYAENRRISRVRWTFDNRSWVDQRFDTSAQNRSVQALRIPPVRARRVTIMILDSSSARRNTVAISTVRILATD